MGSENQIYKSVALFQLFHHMRLLHHTAAESDQHVWIFSFDTVQLAKSSIDSLIRIFSDRTGIVDNEIRLFLLIDHRVTDLLKNSGQLFGVSGIHLTAKCDDRRCQRTSQLL